MGTILASAIIAKARILIHDTVGTRWPDAEMLNWLNDGQREIVLLKPNASIKNVSVAMVEGTKQTIPNDGVSLVTVRRNMGINGTTPGISVTQVDMSLLDEEVREWHFEAPLSGAIHFIFDPQDPKHFYLYPPQPATPHYMEVVYSCNPADVAIGEAISVDDIYQNILIDYLAYRAFSKDSDYAANDGRAGIHYGHFTAALGAKIQAEGATAPQRR